MGQKHGKAVYDEDAKTFLNLSFAAIGTLWETFNDVADGFGINLYEFREICAELGEELQLNRAKLDKRSTALFKLLDTDRNGLIDAIEFISAMACASGMSVADTLEFVFGCYDFDGSGRLTIDEITLAFKSTVTGMCKLEGTGGTRACPRDAYFEAAAMNAFERRAGPDRYKVKMREVIDFCCEQPEIRSWLDYFDDPAENQAVTEEEEHDVIGMGSVPGVGGDKDIRREGQYPARTARETSVAEDDTFSFCQQLPERDPKKMPAWTETVKSLVPTVFSGKTVDRNPPDIGASLQWIHGYSGTICRNNVRYSAGGDIIYPACRACVSYNSTDHQQSFNLDHTDDISSFAIHPLGKLAATGEVGTEPKIVIWDTASLQAVRVLKGLHEKAVALLTFSEDGALLASVGQDDNHCLTVHDWDKGKLLHSGPSDTRSVLGCCFTSSGGLVTCGEGHALFWKKEGQLMVKKKGVFGHKATAQTLLCCSTLQGKVVTGAESGHLYVWSGRNCVRSLRGHYGPVTAMYSGAYGLASGGKDMRIRLWSPRMEAGATFDMSAFGPCPIVHSVCLSSDGTKLLVGVKGCEIYEISAADGSDVSGGPVTTCHFEGQLRGLARHPQREEFVTAGGDGTVRIWDAATRSLLRMTRLDSPASCVDYAPDGELLVVGFGSRTRNISSGGASTSSDTSGKLTTEGEASGSDNKDGGGSGALRRARGKRGKKPGSEDGGGGASSGSSGRNGDAKTGGFIILNEADFVTVFEARDTKKAIIEARWSPDRDTVVLGGEDANLYLYSTGDNFDLIATGQKHKQPVTSVDFSKDGDWIRSNCDGGQLHMWDSNKGKHQSNVTKYKDVEWSTETCSLTWSTRGIHTRIDDGTEILSTDRSPNGLVVAAGDNYSRTRLYRYPCQGDRPPPAMFHELRGHGSGGVSRTRFLKGGKYLITIGGSDRCILQWQLSGAAAGEDKKSAEGMKDTAEAVAEEESDGYVLDMRDGSDLERESDFEDAAEDRRAPAARLRSVKRSKRAVAPRTAAGAASGATAANKTDSFGENTPPPPPQPWEQATVAPSRPPPIDRSSPADSLELERIHGYRGRDARSNAAYAGVDGKRAVYTAASVGISLDLTNYTQTFQAGHVGDAVSLAVSPDGLMVATGEVSKHPAVIVWLAASGEAVRTLSGFHKRAITALSFSPDGRHVASLGCDDDHSIAIFDWENRLLRAMAKGGRRKALSVAWNGTGCRLITCGLRHVSFWTFTGRNLSHCRGIFGGKGRKQTLPCCAFVGDTAVVGTGDGHLYLFENGATVLTRSVKAHTGSVYTLCPVLGTTVPSSSSGGDGSGGAVVAGIWTGGKDGLVKYFNDQIYGLKEFSVATIASNGAAGGAAGALKALAASAAAVGGGGGVSPGGSGGKKRPGAGGASVSLDPAVRSVFASRDGTRILIGTRGGELYEMSAVDGSDAGRGAGGRKGTGIGGVGPLTAGHGRGQVWGLSAHPKERTYATCGDDGSVRVWSLDDRRMVGSISTDCSCRALCYSPDGASLAVGCGGGKGKADTFKSGTFLILKSENLALRHEAKDADDWIRDINYSADGSRLAVAANDCKIYVYATRDGFAKLSVITSHQSFVTHVDFSADGTYVQSADGARSLLFADAATGILIPSASSMKDVEWGTWTLPLGWAARGLWPTDGKESGMEVTCSKRSADHSLLAAGDNYGRLRLFKYPAPLPGSSFSEHRAHSDAIRRVSWSADDTHLLSSGVDGCVFQWRRIIEADGVDSGDEAERSGEDSELEGDGGLHCCSASSPPSAIDVHVGTAPSSDDLTSTALSGGGERDGDGSVEAGAAVASGGGAAGADAAIAGGGMVAALGGGENRVAKPKMLWLSAMVPPSNLKMSNTSAPEICTRLEVVHGCRAGDVRGCLWYNHEEGIIYPAAALCVIYDPRTGRQTYHKGHMGDVISLTVSSCRRFAASGDAASPPRVHVWDTVTGLGIVNGTLGEESGVLPSFHKVGVGLLAFSADGHWLASMGHDPEHMIGVYTSPSGQWGDAFPVATARAGFTRFLCLVFTGHEAFPLLAGGMKAVAFFHHTKGSRTLTRKQGVFGYRRKIQPILCAVKMTEDRTALTGTVSGHLYVWKVHRIERSTVGHAGPVYACAAAGVKGYVTAGKDGFVRLWDSGLQKLKQYGLMEMYPANMVLHSVCSVRSACKFVVCTRAGEVFEISRDSGRILLLSEAHGKKKLLGLAAHPTKPDIFATVGDDAFVRVWSIGGRRCVRKMKVDSAARSLAFSPSGHHLAVGLGGDRDAMVKEGAIIILSAENLEVLEEIRNAKTWIVDMKYTEDGSLLAVASSGGLIYIHDATDHYSLKATTPKPEDGSSITNIDFSIDKEMLQAATSSKDLLFFMTGDGRRVTAKSKTKDTAFQTQTCPMGWNVQGRPDLEPVTTDRCTPCCIEGQPQQGDLLVVGYRTGNVEVFRYPCQNQGARSVCAFGHSTTVGKVRFNADGTTVLSIGSDSRVILQHALLAPISPVQ